MNVGGVLFNGLYIWCSCGLCCFEGFFGFGQVGVFVVEIFWFEFCVVCGFFVEFCSVVFVDYWLCEQFLWFEFEFVVQLLCVQGIEVEIVDIEELIFEVYDFVYWCDMDFQFDVLCL